MRRIDLLSGVLGCLIFIISCTSKKSDFPVVHFINPNVNVIYDLKHDLDIEIDISDDSMIMGYHFWLESDDGWEYFSDNQIINTDSYKLIYKFDLSHNIKNDFSIHLEVWDDDNNKTHEKIDILIQ